MFAEQEDKSERLIFTYSMISQTLLIVGYIHITKRVEINGRMKSSVNYLQSQQLLLLLLLLIN
jgi:hypothetical protein